MKTLTSKIHKYYDLEQNYFAPSSLPKILDVGRIVQSFEKNSYYELVLSSIFLPVLCAPDSHSKVVVEATSVASFKSGPHSKSGHRHVSGQAFNFPERKRGLWNNVVCKRIVVTIPLQKY